jgi:hypothetical protein
MAIGFQNASSQLFFLISKGENQDNPYDRADIRLFPSPNRKSLLSLGIKRIPYRAPRNTTHNIILGRRRLGLDASVHF